MRAAFSALRPIPTMAIVCVAFSGCGDEPTPLEETSAPETVFEFPETGDVLLEVHEPALGSTTYFGTVTGSGEDIEIDLDRLRTEVGTNRFADVDMDDEGRPVLVTLDDNEVTLTHNPDGTLDFTWHVGDSLVATAEGVDYEPRVATPRGVDCGEAFTEIDVLLCVGTVADAMASGLCPGPSAQAFSEILQADPAFVDSGMTGCVLFRTVDASLDCWLEDNCDPDEFYHDHCDEVFAYRRVLQGLIAMWDEVISEMAANIHGALPEDHPCVDPPPTLDNQVEVTASVGPSGRPWRRGGSVDVTFEADSIRVLQQVCPENLPPACPIFHAHAGPAGDLEEEHFLGLLINLPELEAGTYPFIDEKTLNRLAALSFSTPLLQHETPPNLRVVFEANGGTFTLEASGVESGERTRGSLTAEVRGLRRLESGEIAEYTGTVVSAFDVTMP